MSACPPREKLDALLSAELSDAEVAVLTKHLEGCSACQALLDQLSADPDSARWRRLRHTGKSSGHEPRPGFLHRLEQSPPTPFSLPSSPDADASGDDSEPVGPPRSSPEGYDILGELGRGGLGVVYKAHERRLKRTVALKMLLSGAAHGNAGLERLRTEAEIVAKLQHPNIVHIHEVGEHEGCPFLALEFVAGNSLAERLDGTPQPPHDAAQMVETLARAMHHAHQRGIVHRDLKPANILMAKIDDCEWRIDKGGSSIRKPRSSALDSQTWIPKITDFGLAKRLGDVGQTQTGRVLGTPRYMAPEQARGRSRDIGPATDVYALGVILYELLTGRPPFQGVSPVDTVMQVLHDDPIAPRRLERSIPADLETICLKCLEKETRKRYGSAEALADDLARFREGRPVRARRVGLWGQMWRWRRRNPALAMAIVSVAFLFVAGFAGVTWSYLNADHARKRESDARAQAELSLTFSRIALAEREWLANNVGRAEHLLDQCIPLDRRPDPRGFEWHYLKRLCHADLWTRRIHHNPAYDLALSPDGRYLVSAAGDPGYTSKIATTTPGELKLWNAATGEAVGAFVGHTGRVTSAHFSTDGARVASLAADGTVRVWDVASQRQQAVFYGKFRWACSCAAFSPDGRTLAIPDGRSVRLHDLGTGDLVGKLDGLDAWAGRLAFSPDGARLAVVGSITKIHVFDVAERRQECTLAGNYLDRAHAVAFSPDNRHLATTDADSVKLWDMDGGRPALSLRGHNGAVYTVVWSRDGRFLASAGADQTVRIWDAVIGREQLTLRGHTASVLALAYYPEGRQLASVDEAGVLKAWDLTRDQRALSLPHNDSTAVAFGDNGRLVLAVRLHGDASDGVRAWDATTGRPIFDRPFPIAKRREWPLRYVDLSADGRLFTAPDREDPTLVRVWDVMTGGERAALRGHQADVRAVAISADGRRIASAASNRKPDSPGELFIWQLPTAGTQPKQEVPLILTTPAAVRSLVFSPDGARLFTGERGTLPEGEKVFKDGCLSVWDVTSGHLLRRWTAHSGMVQAVACDSRGRWVASAARGPTDHSVHIWDASTGERLHALQGPLMVTSVAFSPDGRRLAAVGYEGTVLLWDTATGQEIVTLRGPAPQMVGWLANDSQVAFSPDGTRIAARAWNGSIFVWDARPLAIGE